MSHGSDVAACDEAATARPLTVSAAAAAARSNALLRCRTRDRNMLVCLLRRGPAATGTRRSRAPRTRVLALTFALRAIVTRWSRGRQRTREPRRGALVTFIAVMAFSRSPGVATPTAWRVTRRTRRRRPGWPRGGRVEQVEPGPARGGHLMAGSLGHRPERAPEH